MASPNGMQFVDNMPSFDGNVTKAADFALSYVAAQIERVSKMRVPHKQGTLQNSGYHKRTGNLQYQIGYGGRAEDYAGVQEFGQRKDGTHKIRNYSEPGTGSNYLRGAAEDVRQSLQPEIRKALGAVRP